MGAVMAVGTPDLATSSDPVSFIGDAAADWISVPYLLIAVVGMVLINSMSMYSAGFTAQTLGFKIPRTWAVRVNAAISLLLGVLLMMATSSFYRFVHLLSDVARGDVLRLDRRLRRGSAAAGVPTTATALLDTTRTSAYWYTGGFAGRP